MTMTRAEYETMASAIHESYLTAEDSAITAEDACLKQEAVKETALSLADALCATNDRFDPLRFLQQCDVDLAEPQIARYSHRLYLRTQTGVGAGRKQVHRTA